MKAFLRKLGLGKVKQSLRKMRLKGKKTEDVFTEIYHKNKWGDEESISGPGSTLKETAHLRAELKKLFKKYKIKTLIDLPCGDFNWFKEIDYDFDQYIGCDIVSELIDANNKQYGSAKRIFKKADCLSETLDEADALIARDLLIHFSNEDIVRFLENIRASNIKYLITSHFLHVEDNENISTGQGRMVNLTKAPFYLPEPSEHFLEESQVYDGLWSGSKSIAIWDVEIIAKALDKKTEKAA